MLYARSQLIQGAQTNYKNSFSNFTWSTRASCFLSSPCSQKGKWQRLWPQNKAAGLLSFYYIIIIVCLFLAVLGFFATLRLSIVCISQGYSLGVVHRLLIAVASPVAEYGP